MSAILSRERVKRRQDRPRPGRDERATVDSISEDFMPQDPGLTVVVDAALDIGDIASATLFAIPPGSTTLELVAAAGIDGPALEGLVTAVRNPEHPVARSITADGPLFDVLPTAPGGPALRSHVPVRVVGDGTNLAVGVLAVAHQSPLSEADRSALLELASVAASELDQRAG
jgi:hypothetical protein